MLMSDTELLQESRDRQAGVEPYCRGRWGKGRDVRHQVSWVVDEGPDWGLRYLLACCSGCE